MTALRAVTAEEQQPATLEELVIEELRIFDATALEIAADLGAPVTRVRRILARAAIRNQVIRYNDGRHWVWKIA